MDDDSAVYDAMQAMLARLPPYRRNSPDAAIALNLARELDSGRLGAPASVARELRECLRSLEADLTPDEADFVDDLTKKRKAV